MKRFWLFHPSNVPPDWSRQSEARLALAKMDRAKQAASPVSDLLVGVQ